MGWPKGRKRKVAAAPEAPPPTPAIPVIPGEPPRVQWFVMGPGAAVILDKPPVAVAPVSTPKPSPLPPLLRAENVDKATHGDTFPTIPPTRQAPDAYPGAVGELQHAPLRSDDNMTGLSYETNMAAFEASDPWDSNPTFANMGFASIKSNFRR